MKYYFFILLVFLMIFSACETAESDNTDPLKQVSQNGEKPDSVIIAEVNNYIKFVEESYQSRQKDVSLNPPIDNEKVVWIDNDKGEFFRVIYGIFSMDPYFKHTYYFKENELIYYRYQTWLRTTTPREAKEFLCVIDDGKIVKAARKYLILEGDEPPVKMAKQPLFEVQVNQDSMLQAIDDHWKMILEKKKNRGGHSRFYCNRNRG